jgi:uncharacterized protein YutE (UPF0331/DUF86 family)
VEAHIITNEEAILMDKLVNIRNTLSHEYGEEKSVESIEYVIASTEFFENLLQKLEQII